MVKIRLKRVGRKKRPFYRVVVTDIRNRRDGAPIEELGYYDPMRKLLKLDKSKAKAWMAKGAEPSGTAKRLIEAASDSGDLVELSKRDKTKRQLKAERAPKQPEPVVEAPAPVAEAEAPAAEAPAEPPQPAAAAAE